MRIVLCRSFHEPQLHSVLKECWNKNELLVWVPCYLKDFSSLQRLPKRDLHFIGQWQAAEKEEILSHGSELDLPSDLIAALLTSGTSSGSPSLLFYTKENLQQSLTSLLSVFDLERIQTVFCYPQPFHIFGFLLGYLFPFLHGLRTVPLKGKYQQGFHQLWQNSKPDLSLGTPTHFQDLLESRPTDLTSTYSCIMGGAPVTLDLWDRVKDQLQIEAPSIGYGSTEACLGISHLNPGERPRADACIGLPLPGVQMQLTERQTLRFSSPFHSRFAIQEGQLVTPTEWELRDELWRDEQGYFYFVGRTDWVINRGGQKVSLESLEMTLQRQLGLRALAFKVPDQRLGEDLALLVRDQIGTELCQVYRIIEENFGMRLRPEQIQFVPELPLNLSGKLDRAPIRLGF